MVYRYQQGVWVILITGHHLGWSWNPQQCNMMLDMFNCSVSSKGLEALMNNWLKCRAIIKKNPHIYTLWLEKRRPRRLSFVIGEVLNKYCFLCLLKWSISQLCSKIIAFISSFCLNLDLDDDISFWVRCTKQPRGSLEMNPLFCLLLTIVFFNVALNFERRPL